MNLVDFNIPLKVLICAMYRHYDSKMFALNKNRINRGKRDCVVTNIETN